MKTIQKIMVLGLVLTAGVSSMTARAYGEMIQGEVTEIDPAGTYLRIARSDPESNSAEAESIKVLVVPSTVFEALEGPTELRPGDEVWAEISQDKETKTWSASKVRLDKVDIKTPADAAAARKAGESKIVL